MADAPTSSTHGDSTTTAPVLVSMHGVNKWFGDLHVLKDINVDIHRGEVVVVIGPSGSGKSTLMKVLAGVYQKDAGEVRIDGQVVDIPSPRAAQNLGIGIIHQELNLMNHRSVAQNIFIGREPRGRFGVFIDAQKMEKDTQKEPKKASHGLLDAWVL